MLEGVWDCLPAGFSMNRPVACRSLNAPRWMRSLPARDRSEENQKQAAKIIDSYKLSFLFCFRARARSAISRCIKPTSRPPPPHRRHRCAPPLLPTNIRSQTSLTVRTSTASPMTRSSVCLEMLPSRRHAKRTGGYHEFMYYYHSI